MHPTIYNGIGHMSGVHEDTDLDGDSDASDKWFYPAYDEAWRMVANFRETDTSPKEEFICQMAGDDGTGLASHINGIVARDKDANTDWVGATDGVLEQRIYYCQNWRGDVVALVEKTKKQVEAVRYTSYGEPFGLPAGDTNSDGDRDSGDAAQFDTWINTSAYDIRADIDLDGDVDGTDKEIAVGYGAVSQGANSLTSVGSRPGFGGYYRLIFEWFARTRRFAAALGRWHARDVLNYVDSASLYEYVVSRPLALVDPTGMLSSSQGTPPPGTPPERIPVACGNTEIRETAIPDKEIKIKLPDETGHRRAAEEKMWASLLEKFDRNHFCDYCEFYKGECPRTVIPITISVKCRLRIAPHVAGGYITDEELNETIPLSFGYYKSKWKCSGHFGALVICDACPDE